MIAIFALQNASVQNYLSKRVAAFLSKELQTSITVDEVQLRSFRAFELKNLNIDDRQGEPMLSIRSATAQISLARILSDKIEIRKVVLDGAFVNYEIYKDSSNFSFLLDYFAPTKKTGEKPKKKMDIRLSEIELIDNSVRLTNHNYKIKRQGFDISNLALSNISGKFSNIELGKDDVRANIAGFSFRDTCGLHLRELSTNAYVSNKRMEFKDLVLRTNNSTLGNYVAFTYDSFADFSDFIEKVSVEAELAQTAIDSRDIEFFAPDMKYVRFATLIKTASLSGTVEHIKAKNTWMSIAQHTELQGDFTIDGLPDINRTIFDFDLKQLHSSAADMESFIPGLANRQTFELPEQLHQLGMINYQGAFKGLYNQFAANGAIATAIGDLEVDTEIDFKSEFLYKGSAHSESFDLGQFLNIPALASTAMEINFDGMGLEKEKLQLVANGLLQRFFVNNYAYEYVDFEAEINQGILQSSLTVDDSFAQLSAEGEISWRDELLTYDLSTDIEIMDLKNLGLVNKDSIVLAQSSLSAKLTGGNINSMVGTISSDHIQFSSSRGEFEMDHLAIEAKGDEGSKTLSISSDAVDGEMSGQIDLATLGNYFQSLAMRYAPAINIEAKPYNPQNFDLRIKIKRFEPISALFDPNISMEEGANLHAQFSSDKYTASFNAFSPRIGYKGMNVDNLMMVENADDKAFSLDVTADRFSFTDSTYIDNIKITNLLANDSLHFNVMLSDEKRPNYLNIHGDVHFEHNKPAYIHFNKSKILLNYEEWKVNQDAELRVSKGKFYLDNLLLKRELQEVAVNGILSDENDDLVLSFKDFSLDALSGFTKPLGIRMQGQMNGDITINSVFKAPNLSAHIATSPIVYNGLPIGSLSIKSDYEPQSGFIKMNADLLDVNQNGLRLSGTYNLNHEDEALRLSGTVKNLDLGIVQPFLRNLVADLYGKASGSVDISGSLKQPIIQGSANVHEASFLVKYLQTRYSLTNQSILIDKNAFVLGDVKIHDYRNTIATAKGSIDLNKLSDPTLNVRVRAENFQMLNTTRKHNELFFGTAYATGDFSFTGPTSAINIDINAQSNPNTVITIPLNSALKVSDNDFIYFVDPAKDKGEILKPKSVFQGVTMNMDLDITRDAEINLENSVGSLKGFGTGALSLRISSLGDFEMFGDYHVLSGKFHFTAQDFFNKYFDLQEGGTIRWAGSPTEAAINLSARYEQRTSVAPLYNAAGHSENNDRTLAQAAMNLKGLLSQPDISFDLNFPQDPYIKDELQGYLSDVNNVNQQAISLIVRRSFTPASTQELGREVNNTLLSAGTEIAFNQLNNIISQSLNMNFLDLNIRSFNDASASLRFFDDRLILTGGVTDRSNATMNDLNIFSDQVATDAELTFRLRQDGNLVLRAYNRLNTKSVLFNPYSEYISAVGVVYRQEFNSLSDFWRKMWIWKERKKKEDAAPKDSIP